MQNAIYTKTIKPGSDAPDGETPTQIILTKEVNCHALWYVSFEEVKMIEALRLTQSECIEIAVDRARAVIIPK